MALLVPQAAFSAQAMEEIVVTATKREQSLQDVPVSVSVVSGEQIKNQSLQNLDDLSNWVPGLTVREGGEQTGISIRGFGAGLNFGFDQSVGLFIDGVYAGRERQFRAQFLDIDSIEVLRGPQATLFGKNTTAGAVIVKTGKPRFDFDASVTAEMGVGVRERQQIQGFVTGGLTENLAARLAVRVSEDDGYLKNTFTGDEEEQEDDWTARLKFLWTPTDRLEVETKFEYSEYERTGRDFQVSDIGGPFSDDTTTPLYAANAPATLAVYRVYDPLFEYDKNRVTSKQRETADVESTNVTVEATYDMDIGTFKSITGYSGYDSVDDRDVDWTPTTYLFEPITQEFDQVSQEFQFVSSVGEKFDYIVGFHYFSTDFYVDRRTDIDIVPFLVPFGVQPDDETIFWSGDPVEDWSYAQLRFLDQERDNYSAYGQGTYHFTPNVHLTFGLRYNREEKEADDRYFLSHFGRSEFLDIDETVVDFFRQRPNTDVPLTGAEVGEVISIATAAGGDNLKIANVCSVGLCENLRSITVNSRLGGGSMVEKDWSPELTLSWDYSDMAMYYAKVTQGHKGGGFNSAATGNTDPRFGDETVTGYELGGKFRFMNGYVNVALFRMEFEDLQTAVWTGNEFDVGNAGDSFSQGLELDSRWQLTDRIQLNGSLIWNDARYDENVGNNCTVPQLNFGAPGCFNENGLAPGDAGATGPFFQDLTGDRFAPIFQGNIGIGYVRPIFSNMELLLRGDAVYYSDQENRDPTIEQPSVTLVDLRAELRQTMGPWSASVLIKNATDEEHWWYEFEAPVQPGTRIGFLAPPRTVAFRLTYDLN